MTKAATAKLYVQLSASQARKRLKGHGLGVKKVESAGRNEAVIHHTATGQHLRELEGLLGDVMLATFRCEADPQVESLRNLGGTSAAWLAEIGVYTRSDLERMGPVLAFQLVKQRQPSASLNLLWALTAALTDRDWRELPEQEKQQLRAEVEQ